MGERVSSSIVVTASAAAVHAVITDLSAYPEWADGVTNVQVDERDDQGRPVVARFTTDAKVVDVHYTLRYEYDDDDIRWTLVEGEMVSQLDGQYRLEEAQGTTTVFYELEVDVSIPLPGFLKKRAARQILETGLKGLKQRTESRD